MGFADIEQKIETFIPKLEELAKKYIGDDQPRIQFMTEASALFQESMSAASLLKEEVESKDWYQKEWHPSIGWTAWLGLTLYFVIFPIAYNLKALLHNQPQPPFDSQSLLYLVVLLMGYGTLVSAPPIIDKIKGMINNVDSPSK